MSNLSLNKSSGTGTAKNHQRDGIFVNLVTILKARDITKTDDNKFDREIAIELKCEIDRSPQENWERTITIGGNWKRDSQTKEVLDWGGAFKIKDLLNACMIEEGDLWDEGHTLKQEVVNSLVGKEILLLSYKKADGKYGYWDLVGAPTRNRRQFADFFYQQWMKRGYPKNYNGGDDAAFDGPSPKAATNISQAAQANATLSI